MDKIISLGSNQTFRDVLLSQYHFQVNILSRNEFYYQIKCVPLNMIFILYVSSYRDVLRHPARFLNQYIGYPQRLIHYTTGINALYS